MGENNNQEIVKEESGEATRQVAANTPLPTKPAATACDCPPGCVGLPCCH
jgi:hypothetical protein